MRSGGPSAVASLAPPERLPNGYSTREYAAVVHAERMDDRAGPLIAQALEDALTARGWPAGQVFGPERVLASNFDVAVPRLRQAVRILEGRGACRMRRGPGGGLVVLPPSRRQAAEVLADHLRWTGVMAEHVWDMRRWLEPVAAAAAAEAGRVDATLAAVAANPCLALSLECLDQFPGAMGEVANPAQDALWRAIAAGDAKTAAGLAQENVALRRAAAAEGRWPLSAIRRLGAPSGNFASQIAARIAADVTFPRCRDQDWLGAVPELCERYGASHGVMIEAIRLLEDAQVVESRRGRGGGVALRTPSPGAIVPLLHAHIASAGTSRWQAYEMSRMLNGFAAAEAARSPRHADRWSRHAQAAAGAAPAAAQVTWLLLQREIYDAADNPVLHALGRCIAGYNVRAHAPKAPLSGPAAEMLLDLCRGVAVALSRRDAEGAVCGQNAGLDLVVLD